MSPPKKSARKKIEKKFNASNLLYTPYGRVSEKHFFSYRKKNGEKNRPTGGVVPQGGGLQGECSPPGGTAWGGAGREEKSSRKNLESESPQKKSARKILEKKI